LLLCLSIVACHCGSCEHWRQEEDRCNHDCRSCRDVNIDDLANCPEGGTCDEKEPLRPGVLSTSDSCTCQSLKCANKGWRLAVNRTFVDKVRCKDGQWYSSGVIASSLVCAKMPTDPGIPATPKPLICPKLEPADIEVCKASPGSGGKCFALPVIEELTIRCPNTPPNTLYVEVGAGGAFNGNTEMTCDPATKKWKLVDDAIFADAKKVACIDRSPGGG
ncbi:hypothetical protein PENTCL1PPCAC_9724, partial [Pristionchus entomophagus]